MRGAEVVQRARLRAGLSVDGLAERLGYSPATILQWEKGEIEPTFRAVEELVVSCGFDLAKLIAEPELDPHDLGLLETSLSLTIDQRLRRNTNYVNFVRAGQRAMRDVS